MNSRLIVTTLDEPYFVGLVALHNSFLKHSAEGFDFAALVFGSEDLVKRVEDRGIRVIANPPFPVATLPLGKHHRDPARLPPMYGRLLIPGLFPEYRRIVFVDADSIILQSLLPLADMPMRHPIAATKCNGPITYNIVGRDYPDAFGPMSSFYVIDRELWNARKIDQKWIAAIQDPALSFPFTVQGVLQAAIESDWHCLPWDTQAHAGHKTLTTAPRKRVYTLHFMGTNPWDRLDPNANLTYQLPARALWDEYRCMS